MCKSIIDFRLLSLQPWYLRAYSHLTPQEGLYPSAVYSQHSACIQDMSRSNSNSLLLLQHNFSYCKSLYLPDTDCCEAIRTVTNNEQQRKIEAKTNKMKQWQQQRKIEHSIFWNWNISSAHLQKDVNPLKSTLIYILSAFLLSKHVKRYERLSKSKTRF